MEAIRKIGAERVILSSDCGQVNAAPHPDALVRAAKALMSHGITEREIDLMLKKNPAGLLGLSPR